MFIIRNLKFISQKVLDKINDVRDTLFMKKLIANKKLRTILLDEYNNLTNNNILLENLDSKIKFMLILKRKGIVKTIDLIRGVVIFEHFLSRNLDVVDAVDNTIVIYKMSKNYNKNMILNNPKKFNKDILAKNFNIVLEEKIKNDSNYQNLLYKIQNRYNENIKKVKTRQEIYKLKILKSEDSKKLKRNFIKCNKKEIMKITFSKTRRDTYFIKIMLGII